jgi:colanic acid biosynthesis glycosyl transferase WcaI
LTAAKDLLTIPHARFIICGEGPYRLQLELQAKSMGLTNIHFLPLQPIEKFNAFLNMADVHLIIQKKNAGDLVMPSKLTNILSVGGLAIVTCDAGTTLYKTLQENTIGIAIAPENPAMLSQSILQAINNNSKIRHTAREYAVTLLSKDTILSRYLSCISFKAGI